MPKNGTIRKIPLGLPLKKKGGRNALTLISPPFVKGGGGETRFNGLVLVLGTWMQEYWD